MYVKFYSYGKLKSVCKSLIGEYKISSLFSHLLLILIGMISEYKQGLFIFIQLIGDYKWYLCVKSSVAIMIFQYPITICHVLVISIASFSIIMRNNLHCRIAFRNNFHWLSFKEQIENSIKILKQNPLFVESKSESTWSRIS